MVAKSQKDQYLDNAILGRPGAAKQLRRIPQAMDRALSEAGLTHKAYKGKKVGAEQAQAHANVPNLTSDPELQAKMHSAIANHFATKAGMADPASGEADTDEFDNAPFEGYDENGDQEPMVGKEFSIPALHEDPEGETEADDDEEMEDEFGDVEPGSLKAQAGYEEPDKGGQVMTPPLVSQAITKRPGNFPPPVQHQVATGKGKSLQGYVTRAEYNRVVKAYKSLETRLGQAETALGEVAVFVENVKAFNPSRASIDPATAITDQSVIREIKSINETPDNFWHTSLG